MRVEFSPFVEEDLAAIADYIAQDSPRHAIEFIQKIREEIRRIGKIL